MGHDKANFAVIMLVLLLSFSFMLSSSSAVPTSRTFKSFKDEHPSVQDFHSQGETLEMRWSDAGEVEEEVFVGAGRMVLETTDYPGTGANNNHDPSTPGGKT
ncbi:uncharacterized protein LOC127789556 [Diospyros lotus]|uniref:uncharacterized protein LOC127789556 n=1 Tax=Diospyros lotus TaxID=55363 RepID=UPI002254CBFB|nr:uncharacterized protein LOC127789556 [Diospyros lotus]